MSHSAARDADEATVMITSQSHPNNPHNQQPPSCGHVGSIADEAGFRVKGELGHPSSATPFSHQQHFKGMCTHLCERFDRLASASDLEPGSPQLRSVGLRGLQCAEATGQRCSEEALRAEAWSLSELHCCGGIRCVFSARYIQP